MPKIKDENGEYKWVPECDAFEALPPGVSACEYGAYSGLCYCGVELRREDSSGACPHCGVSMFWHSRNKKDGSTALLCELEREVGCFNEGKKRSKDECLR